MIALIVLGSAVLFGLSYLFFGGYLSRQLNLDDSRITPACEINDGVDFVPAKPSLLLGQHFSAIAAAGPIVGPVLAGLWFGWLPALLWIVLGAILVGGVHDITSLTASIRHRATSVGELVRRYMSPLSQVLFLSFVWLALVYVIVAFTDITAQTFKYVTTESQFGAGVAVSSGLYLALSVAMGVALRIFRVPLNLATAVSLPLLFAIIWFGPRMPGPLLDWIGGVSAKQWDVVILLYCFVASLAPLWILLQPRGYLGGWFLYITIAAGLLGALFGGYTLQYPAVNLDGLHSALNGKPLMPILFITIACGACSGFHSIICSGTTSKQLQKETDARRIGYGTMVLEGLVAVLALATVMMLAPGDPLLKEDPNLVYANGLAKYMSLVGIDYNLALTFSLLAFSTFVYDTLDVCTRLARYVLQELLGWKSMAGGVVATTITLAVPLVILLSTREKGYMVAWPLFGASNQLLASLTLLAVSVWLIKTGRKAWYAVAPMAFMMTVTLWALYLLVLPFVKVLPAFLRGQAGITPDVAISGVVGIVLMVLAVFLLAEAFNVLVLKGQGNPPAEGGDLEAVAG
jgi:carbon starvation protein